PVGFKFTCNGAKLGLVTDLGTPTNLVKTHMAGCHGLIIESNHDSRMLMEGPYPWDLKRRVRGRKGHLSNDDAAKLLSELAHGDLKQVVLAHLSEINNKPELALSEVSSYLPHISGSFRLEAASQDVPSPVFRL
ncbi:MAG: MBL fold metallo-hydrolase, partial [Deltaproteobacteria bacterium]|nr:MBL fold metallo-hydrolase [Deltaproteobacteria bacterium]